MEQTMRFEDAVSRLLETLKIEKKELLAGSFDSLVELSESKARYLSLIDSYLSEDPASYAGYAEYINAIQSRARENEKLLQAAKSGVCDAQGRLKSLSEREIAVGTYLQDGAKLQSHHSATTRRKIA